jgi:hypothetical protein
VKTEPVDLDDIVVWSARSKNGRQVWIKVLANGDAASGLYDLDVCHGGPERSRTDKVVSSLKQNEWIRVILRRSRGQQSVALWVGPPDKERYVGSFPDLNPGKDAALFDVGDESDDENTGSGYWDDLRVGGMLGAGQEVAPPEPRLRNVGEELPVIDFPVRVGKEKQLFIDDVIIESSVNLTRRLHPVNKHPDNPLIVADKPWEGVCVLINGSIMFDPDYGKYRAWYLAWGKHVGKPNHVAYAESEDGLRWTKPNVGLHEFEGSLNNNIVIPNIRSVTAVIRDPDDGDPGQRYKAIVRCNYGTGVWLSPDGLHWREHGLLIDQCYDATSVHRDPIGEKWIASVFFTWSDTYFMTTVDERDGEHDQMYFMPIFHYETIYLGLLRMYHLDSDKVDVQLASSRNAKHWDRLIREPIIPCSSVKGAWDYGNNCTSSDPPVRVGDELWIYYSGRSTMHNEVPNRGAIGLGTLRLDGFVSMNAGEEEGTLLTKPVRLCGKDLFLNVDAAEGVVQCEVLTDSSGPIRGFSRADCRPINKDRVREPVRWGSGKDLSSVSDKSVRLRFFLSNAQLFAFWTE